MKPGLKQKIIGPLILLHGKGLRHIGIDGPIRTRNRWFNKEPIFKQIQMITQS